jgi:hypothetical protein
MDKAVALHFRDALRVARAEALRDGESFEGIVFVIERLGSLLYGRRASLRKYEPALTARASRSVLAEAIPRACPGYHTPFARLFAHVRQARNSALHEGAYARHLTANATALALIVEDALLDGQSQVGDFMVRSPVCAFPWQPLGFVRQTMLANSFSFLPMLWQEAGACAWRLVSDYAVAHYLRQATTAGDRETSMSQTLATAVASGGIVLTQPFVCGPETEVAEVLSNCRGVPAIVCARGTPEILGIATPFDLL